VEFKPKEFHIKPSHDRQRCVAMRSSRHKGGLSVKRTLEGEHDSESTSPSFSTNSNIHSSTVLRPGERLDEGAVDIICLVAQRNDEGRRFVSLQSPWPASTGPGAT